MILGYGNTPSIYLGSFFLRQRLSLEVLLPCRSCLVVQVSNVISSGRAHVRFLRAASADPLLCAHVRAAFLGPAAPLTALKENRHAAKINYITSLKGATHNFTIISWKRRLSTTQMLVWRYVRP